MSWQSVHPLPWFKKYLSIPYIIERRIILLYFHPKVCGVMADGWIYLPRRSCSPITLVIIIMRAKGRKGTVSQVPACGDSDSPSWNSSTARLKLILRKESNQITKTWKYQRNVQIFDKLVGLWLGDPKFMNSIIADFLRACHFVGIAQEEYLYTLKLLASTFRCQFHSCEVSPCLASNSPKEQKPFELQFLRFNLSNTSRN